MKKILIVALSLALIYGIYQLYFYKEIKAIDYYENIIQDKLPEMLSYLDSFPLQNAVRYSCFRGYDLDPTPKKFKYEYLTENLLPSEEQSATFLKPFLNNQEKFVIFSYTNYKKNKSFLIVPSIEEYCKNYELSYNTVHCPDTITTIVNRGIENNCYISYCNVKHCQEKRTMVNYSNICMKNGENYWVDIKIYLK